ncbi:MAG: hypothetical protein HOV77_07155 [Hamadaea sp.]|uniref:hypothetical protein n=1 Tax=Hamadaea sp. TaxID=2024425 RepID=UPI001821377E|nr:hypothetical protein [Hamadaea sp.]NUT18947.1 hypothetical protein [Hamadaea sp.]
MATKEADRETAAAEPERPRKSQEHLLRYLRGVVYHDDEEEARSETTGRRPR